MPLTAGTRIGPYEITAQIGAGGMGEVYRARDAKLDRDVAIKVLPETFTSDPDRLARFQREAKVLASLNHPNIAAIYGIEDSSATPALVMELVEGPTLADRIAQGPVPVDEALPIAKQIAEALEAAHERGIVHRDLKPANIKVRPDGTVKVLDFGLAKLAHGPASNLQPPASIPLSISPTVTTPAMTQAGMILGTAAYMSPEQARGQLVDRRTDIWAFGCVLYEMLTGRPAFEGKELVDVLGAVTMLEPDWTPLPVALPPTVRAYLMRCLQKNPHERVQSTGDVRLALDGAFETAGPTSVTRGASRTLGHRVAGLLAAAATVGVVVLAVALLRTRGETPSETRLAVVTPPTTDLTSFALSPDGKSMVYVASGDGPSRLWVRPLAATTAQPLAGTENATAPFWSPDGRSVGFFADGTLKRVNLDGGAPQVLASAQGARGGTWNAEGAILFAKSSGPILRVSATGGAVDVVTTLDRQSSHRLPSFLPDGRHFLFFAYGIVAETTGLYLGTLDSQHVQRLTPDVSSGAYLSPGWLLWVRAGTLVARRLDLEREALTGDAVTVADPVLVDSTYNSSALSVSKAGLVAYRTGGIIRRQLTWFDRSGNALGTLGAGDESGFASPHVSPDGGRVAATRTVDGNSDIWLLDRVRTTRFTFDAGTDQFPVWSPDGRRIAFQSDRDGLRSIYDKPSSGVGEAETLVRAGEITVPTDWSRDGRFLLYYSIDPQTTRDLWVLPIGGHDQPWALLKTRFDERWGQFSPDGRWVAYMSDESGRDEIYVRPFAAPSEFAAGVNSPGGERQISTAGGLFPRWSADGRELYYIGPDGELMAAPITVTGRDLVPGPPFGLFRTRIVGGGVDNTLGPQYDVNREGHFLMNVNVEPAAAAPITLIQNWQPKPAK